jgi:hypothetical protein
MLLNALAAGVSPLSGGAAAPLTPRASGRLAVRELVEPPVAPLFNDTLWGPSWGSQEEEALAFLQQHQPEADAAGLSEAVLSNGVRLALQARNATPWARAVPWEVFLNDVLPYAVLNEARENWRPLFHHAFMPLVANASSTTEAALRLNQHIWDLVEVKYEEQLSPHITSPLEALAYKRASCTGLTVLLVDACRAVGVPARMALVGEWAPPNSGNHNWVEVWVEDHWEFTGAFDGDGAMMNKTWFTERVKGQDASVPSQRVYATTWKPAADSLTLPPLCLSTGGDATRVNAVERTAYYNAVDPPGEDYDEGTQGGKVPRQGR